VAHIKTTHVGSLPRGEELTPLLLARDAGKPYDAAEFDAKVGAAVAEAVRQQVDAGVSIVSDGELGKVGYSTYMIERLSGFGGHIDRKPAADLAEVPGLAKKLAAIMGAQEFVRACASGRSSSSRSSRCTTISAASAPRSTSMPRPKRRRS
jgi:5-methyltetrahydropteroyltriglutamate--homocysteine methyltransferase